MKLYAFYPKGHGQDSYFVCAASEAEARLAVETKPHYADDYLMEIFEAGQVAENSND